MLTHRKRPMPWSAPVLLLSVPSEFLSISKMYTQRGTFWVVTLPWSLGPQLWGWWTGLWPIDLGLRLWILGMFSPPPLPSNNTGQEFCWSQIKVISYSENGKQGVILCIFFNSRPVRLRSSLKWILLVLLERIMTGSLEEERGRSCGNK